VDLLTQARQFISKKASKLAMVAVPLAALAAAVPAKAATVTLDGNGTDTCQAFLSGGCTLTTNPVGGNPFMNQVVLTGSTTSTSGGNTDFASFSNSGGGTAIGTLPVGSVPVSWDFTVMDNLGTVNWSLQFLLSFADGAFTFSTSGSTTGGEVTGSGSINVTGAEAILAYGIEISASGGSAFNLAVPLTLNSAAQTSAPEPASLLLMGAGGAALVLLRRKKV
jgi:PEP-CTERM motif